MATQMKPPAGVKIFNSRRRIRKSFGQIGEVVQMPNLIEVQRESYEQFLRSNPATGYVSGLEKTLRSVFPIRDFAGTAELDFVHYELEEPKYDVDECRQRGMTYAAPMRVTLRLIVFEVDQDSETRSVLDIKEQDVYMGDMPLMTGNGTFIVNGTERVIVSQMHRSPGVFFDHDRGKTHSSGKYLFAARIIPYRGSWLDFEFDAKDIVNVRIDRKRKLPVTSLMYALGWNSEEVLNLFYNRVVWVRGNSPAGQPGWVVPFVEASWRNAKPVFDVVNADTGEIIFTQGTKITPRMVRKAAADGMTALLIPTEEIYGRYSAFDLINEATGEIYIEAGDELTAENLERIDRAGQTSIELLDIDHVQVGPWIRNTLMADKVEERDHALAEIYRVMRPGEPPTRETAEAMFFGLFFDPDRYDLSAVGRVKMNMRLNLDCPDDITVLRREDIATVVKTLVELKDGKGEIDDIDNLGNRRVRSVGELLENQYRVGLLRMERAVKERMSSVDIDTVMPNDLINAKPAVAAVREFFGSSQLSQFMDQTNPLSEVTHKRRVSALGPGGLTRERAGFEVRDVHPTHYGRICPIETPEGPNIGLINSLATFSRVNKYGFIETPYRKVIDTRLTNEVVYLSAMEEARHTIAQANAGIDADGRFTEDLVSAREAGEFLMAPKNQITLADVSPKQLVSVAASLIPFLENDDANRALMGSNMQRQAVPLVKAESPFVGTGMEGTVARDSGAAIGAKRGGIVDQVDASRIVIRATQDVEPGKSGVDIYTLMKFQRSNQSTCINQRPLVTVGDIVAKGDIIADGPSTEDGELALGRNVLVAFMPWNGYNYEDSILINEKIVKEDVFTSIHIDDFEVMAR
ncbi:DNA-directed RNA polymerase subunit beta, partial [Sandarakinorhabdus sp.]|uniref:DNA-directed RNA polymerase subunit beta n=1 Tax=Sandarakinorhabdus sp. TaxID=1916663 RepID=UPI00333FB72C